MGENSKPTYCLFDTYDLYLEGDQGKTAASSKLTVSNVLSVDMEVNFHACRLLPPSSPVPWLATGIWRHSAHLASSPAPVLPSSITREKVSVFRKVAETCAVFVSGLIVPFKSKAELSDGEAMEDGEIDDMETEKDDSPAANYESGKETNSVVEGKPGESSALHTLEHAYSEGESTDTPLSLISEYFEKVVSKEKKENELTDRQNENKEGNQILELNERENLGSHNVGSLNTSDDDGNARIVKLKETETLGRECSDMQSEVSNPVSITEPVNIEESDVQTFVDIAKQILDNITEGLATEVKETSEELTVGNINDVKGEEDVKEVSEVAMVKDITEVKYENYESEEKLEKSETEKGDVNDLD